jgi:PEP-CTERM motif-containing protein
MLAPRVFVGLLIMFVVLLLTATDVAAVNVDVSGDFTSTLDVTTDGTYDFSLLGDTGSSRLLIDGIAVIEGSTDFASVSLTQGIHSLEIQFDACCGGIQLVLPDEHVSLQRVPEPSTLLLLGAALAVLAVAARMRDRWSRERSR